jgi:hypothetical protein
MFVVSWLFRCLVVETVYKLVCDMNTHQIEKRLLPVKAVSESISRGLLLGCLICIKMKYCRLWLIMD